MPVKRFWPPTKHKLLYANVIVYLAIVVLLFLFFAEIKWAQRNLRAYLFTGEFDPTADKLLVRKVIRERDAKTTQKLLEQALDIDPYSPARLVLGKYYLSRGQAENMLAQYQRYRSIDPSVVSVYEELASVLLRQNRQQEARELVNEGIEYFQRRIELYEPHRDSTVNHAFNDKAFGIRAKAHEGFKILEQLKNQLE